MAKKGSSNASKNAVAKKTAWKGITIRNKPPSRPESLASVQSQESHKTVQSSEQASLASTATDTTAIADNNETNSVSPSATKTTNDKDALNNASNGRVGSTKDIEDGNQGTTATEPSTPRAASSRSRASSIALDSASEVFEDAEENSDDDDDDDQQAVSNMSLILPALQNAMADADSHTLDDQKQPYDEATATKKEERQRTTYEPDLIAEIEALEVGTTYPVMAEEKAPSSPFKEGCQNLAFSTEIQSKENGQQPAVAHNEEEPSIRAPVADSDTTRNTAAHDQQDQPPNTKTDNEMQKDSDQRENDPLAKSAPIGNEQQKDNEKPRGEQMEKAAKVTEVDASCEKKRLAEAEAETEAEGGGPDSVEDIEALEVGSSIPFPSLTFPEKSNDKVESVQVQDKEPQADVTASTPSEEPTAHDRKTVNTVSDEAIPSEAISKDEKTVQVLTEERKASDQPTEANIVDEKAVPSKSEPLTLSEEPVASDTTMATPCLGGKAPESEAAVLVAAVADSADDSPFQPVESSNPKTHVKVEQDAVQNGKRGVEVVQETERIPSEDCVRANRSREFEHSIEDPIDLDMFRDNIIAIQSVDAKNIPANDLGPREQEEADEPVREGMQYLFDNKFMKAKATFQVKASIDPLYALGLGAMAFIKAMMTYHEKDVEMAMAALATAYTVAKSQIDNSGFKKPLKESLSQYFTSFLSSNSTGLPASPPPTNVASQRASTQREETPHFIPNGVLRAHVVKAECCLLMSVLQLAQESVVGYLKCGLNLRQAYNSYSIVWQEYKRMGQTYTQYMDRDTVSAIQFGIGTVHLILSSMPAKILKIFSTLGWKSDKQLGFALLKVCMEGQGIRAPLASLTLLAYYSILTSFTPQLYAKEMMGPAIECLLDAQKHHPNSCFFLFFAARIARVARNMPLSTQSFTFAAESSRGEWAEVAMKQMSDYEIGFNYALQLDWERAASYFEQLSREKYWSPAFSKYFVGACYEMLGRRTEGILAFAEVPQLAKDQQGRKTYIDAYVQKKVEFFQRSGYQDMDFSLPGLELLLVMNAFEQMDKESLEKSLALVQRTLELIYDREKMEYNIRLRELVPATTPPDYYDQRAILLLIKSSVLNALKRHKECIAHLNWILDHKHCLKVESWVVPFAYWESGVTSWGLGNIRKSRKLWQLALACTKYDFEYRMAVRLSLAINKCDEAGINFIEQKPSKGLTTNGRKRMPIVHASSC